jgi:hypothetical protein
MYDCKFNFPATRLQCTNGDNSCIKRLPGNDAMQIFPLSPARPLSLDAAIATEAAFKGKMDILMQQAPVFFVNGYVFVRITCYKL